MSGNQIAVTAYSIKSRWTLSEQGWLLASVDGALTAADTNRMSAEIVGVTRAAEATASAAASVRGLADEPGAQAEALRAKVDGFVPGSLSLSEKPGSRLI